MLKENEKTTLVAKTLVVKLGDKRGQFVNISKLHEGLHGVSVPHLWPGDTPDDKIIEGLVNVYDKVTKGNTQVMDSIITRLDEMCDIIKLDISIHKDDAIKS